MTFTIPPAASKQRQRKPTTPIVESLRPLSAWSDEELWALVHAEAADWRSCLARLERAQRWFAAHDRSHPRWSEAMLKRARLNDAMFRARLSAEHAVAALAGRNSKAPEDGQHWGRAVWCNFMPDPVRTAQASDDMSPWSWWPLWAGPLPDGRDDRPPRREEWER